MRTAGGAGSPCPTGKFRTQDFEAFTLLVNSRLLLAFPAGTWPGISSSVVPFRKPIATRLRVMAYQYLPCDQVVPNA